MPVLQAAVGGAQARAAATMPSLLPCPLERVQATMSPWPCTCTVGLDLTHPSPQPVVVTGVNFCPLHQAAPDLLAALMELYGSDMQEAAEGLKGKRSIEGANRSLEAKIQARAAIAQTTGGQLGKDKT